MRTTSILKMYMQVRGDAGLRDGRRSRTRARHLGAGINAIFKGSGL